MLASGLDLRLCSVSGDLRAAFVTELRAWGELVLTVRTLRGFLVRATFAAELRARVHLRATLNALFTGRGRATRGGCVRSG